MDSVFSFICILLIALYFIDFSSGTAQHVVRPHLIDAKDSTEKSPLDYAIHHGNLDVMKALVEWGANTEFYQSNMLIRVYNTWHAVINATPIYALTHTNRSLSVFQALHWTKGVDRSDVVEAILQQCSKCVQSVNLEKQTALHIVVQEKLINSGSLE